MSTAEQSQREYYERTAHLYDQLHVCAGDEHFVALKHISSLIQMHGLSSVLDVGCGTGRGLSYFLKNLPGIEAQGIEPIAALRARAVEEHGIPSNLITAGTGEALPFRDGSFDAVCELGVLHHLRKPETAVSEMVRVARRAIFLSDENRFAHGSAISRWGKLLLCKTGVFRLAYQIKTVGRGHRFSEGDGIAYSYSVYDAMEVLSGWADRIFLIPTDNVRGRASWFHPLMTSFHVLLCAIKDEGIR